MWINRGNVNCGRTVPLRTPSSFILLPWPPKTVSLFFFQSRGKHITRELLLPNCTFHHAVLYYLVDLFLLSSSCSSPSSQTDPWHRRRQESRSAANILINKPPLVLYNRQIDRKRIIIILFIAILYSRFPVTKQAAYVKRQSRLFAGTPVPETRDLDCVLILICFYKAVSADRQTPRRQTRHWVCAPKPVVAAAAEA